MSTDSRVGSDFAGYGIESVLGRGGMGVVYLATDRRLDRQVALKVLTPDLAQDQKFRERFIHESQIAARLEHPNILPIYEAGEAEGELFIAMRYVRGADLRSVLDEQGAIDPGRAVAIIGDVGAALDEAHGEGLIHRDVKPANVILAPSRGPGAPERAYLMDFGVTRRAASPSGLTQTGEFMGTVDYAAPEQIEGKTVDARSDVYSLGCVLYECLTGRPPFVRDSDVATMYAHLRDRPPKPSSSRDGLPAGLDAVVTTAMAKDPSDRYGSAGDLAAAARRALAGTSTTAVGRRPRSRRLRFAGLVAAAAVVAAAATAVALRSSDGRAPGPGASPSGAARVQGVLRIDPTSGRVVSSVALRTLPLTSPLAFGDGFLWALTSDGVRKVNNAGTLVGEPIDVARAVGCLRLGGPGCRVSVAAGEGSAWVLTTVIPPGVSVQTADSVLVKVDPLTNRIETFALRGIAPGGGFSAVPLEAGEGGVWTIDRDPPALVRVDPSNPRRTQRFRLSGPGDGIGVGFGSIWVRHNAARESFLTRVDPESGATLAEITLPGSADGLAFGSGSVWVSDATADELLRIDPDTNTIGAHFAVGTDPKAVVIDAAGGVWVHLTGEETPAGPGKVVRIDPVTDEVLAEVPIGGYDAIGGVPTRRNGMVFGFGSIWVG
jgi:predicted Ser/Thr protein kinase/streptogramin lyase